MESVIHYNGGIQSYRLTMGKAKSNTSMNQYLFYCLNRGYNYIEVQSFIDYYHLFHHIKLTLQATPEWKVEVEKLEQMLMDSYYTHLHSYKKPNREGLEIMEIKELILQELHDLKPIDVGGLTETEASAQALIAEVKESVTKGNRMSFKLMQELSQKLEELSLGEDKRKQDIIKEELSYAHKREQDLIKLLLDMYDLLELISTSIKQSGNDEWSQEVDSIIHKALDLLAEYGIQALEVQDKLFDGVIMEGIDTISQRAIPSHYEKYQVYSVIRRGFMNAHTNELLRKAKVRTVL